MIGQGYQTLKTNFGSNFLEKDSEYVLPNETNIKIKQTNRENYNKQLLYLNYKSPAETVSVKNGNNSTFYKDERTRLSDIELFYSAIIPNDINCKLSLINIANNNSIFGTRIRF